MGARLPARRLLGLAALGLGLAFACSGSRNPLLGEWQVDPDENRPGVLALLREMGDERIVFERASARLGETELPVRYEVGESAVRVLRTDREAEHEVELLEGNRIRVHFPAGYTAVYRRAPSGGAG